MAPKIYTSSYPPLDLPTTSIFTCLFAPHPSPAPAGNIGGFPSSAPAFIDAVSGVVISRSQLRSLVLSLGYGMLLAEKDGGLGLKRGDTIMVFSANSIVFPIIMLAAMAAGLKATLANSAYTEHELGYQWDDSGAKVIFVGPPLIGAAEGMMKGNGRRGKIVVNETEWLTGLKDEGLTAHTYLKLQSLFSHGSLNSEVKLSPSEAKKTTAYLCYSSGTTGKPKGVETTHKNITSVISMAKVAFPPLIHGKDVMLGVLPFYHIYGAVKLLHFPLFAGVPVVIMQRFDMEQFCANIEKYRVTIALVVPPMLLGLAKHPVTSKYNLKSLEVLFSGAAPLGSTLVNAVRKRLESVGVDAAVTQGYGLTETSPTTHMLPPAHSLAKVGSIGLLLPNLEARLIVPDTSSEGGKGSEDVKEGEAGELWLRGESIMKGYLGNPTATADAITPDGWFRTGDICIRDKDGFYTIVDRRKELIKYKGFQVPPAELESVLLQNPDIADVAVIGIDNREQETELPRAYVVHANPSSLKSEADKVAFGKSVQEWIKPKVAKHKYLRGGVVVIDVIPKSAAGKILRRELRELAKTEVQTAKAKL